MIAGGLANGPDHDIPASINMFIGFGLLPARSLTWSWVDEPNGIFTTDGGSKQFRITYSADRMTYEAKPLEG